MSPCVALRISSETSTMGGVSATEVKELTVIPWRSSPWAQVTRVTPVVHRRITRRRSSGSIIIGLPPG